MVCLHRSSDSSVVSLKFSSLNFGDPLCSVDFDLYLLRPGRDDIVLNPSREIADYGIQRNVSSYNSILLLSLLGSYH